MQRVSAVLLLTIVGLAWAPAAEAQGADARVWVLPLEIDADFGAANGNAIIGRLQPLNSIRISDSWKLVNIALVTIADAPGGTPGQPGNPEPIPGPKVFGLGDITDVLVLSPNTTNRFQWGLGIAVGIPTATDISLGSGKWQAGPAFRVNYLSGGWALGLLATTRWSFAGDRDRADTSQLMARGTIRRTLGKRWFFLSAPIITANWKAASDQRWLVPLGGGLGRSFKLGATNLNVSVQAYANVVKPDGAPDSVVRVGFTIPFRLPARAGNG